MDNRIIKQIDRYLSKHRPIQKPVIGASSSTNLKCVIVIPSLAEVDHLPIVLTSLEKGSKRLSEAEVLVVINNSDHALPEVLDNNQRTLELVKQWPSHSLQVVAVDCTSPGNWINQEQAGVGMARRIGMDIGLQRLVKAGQPERSVIVCLDADSPVGSGYVDALLEQYDHHDPPFGGYCMYEHPVPSDPALAESVLYYELWLRYFEWGLKCSGSRFAFPTIGSTINVSPFAYAMADGMEPRRAGEDFHFLQKIAKISLEKPLAPIKNARVYPMARVSDRVLFGTGKAMQSSLEDHPTLYSMVEPANLFLELNAFFNTIEPSYSSLELLKESCSPFLYTFINQHNGWQKLERFRQDYPTDHHYCRAVQNWFDGMKIVRYANLYAGKYGKQPIDAALFELIKGSPMLSKMIEKYNVDYQFLQRAKDWLRFLRQVTAEVEVRQ